MTFQFVIAHLDTNTITNSNAIVGDFGVRLLLFEHVRLLNVFSLVLERRTRSG